MSADWGPLSPLMEAWAHLESAVRLLPISSGSILAEHVEAAYHLIDAERERANRVSRLPENQDDIRIRAIETARAQAESVTDPEQKAQLLESLRTAERVAK